MNVEPIDFDRCARADIVGATVRTMQSAASIMMIGKWRANRCCRNGLSSQIAATIAAATSHQQAVDAAAAR